MMALSLARASSSLNTIWANAGRSSSPSGPTMPAPNVSSTAANPGVPAWTTSRAARSESRMTAPCSASSADTVLLPAPIPPVSVILIVVTVNESPAP
jgi:hypothetical protein